MMLILPDVDMTEICFVRI